MIHFTMARNEISYCSSGGNEALCFSSWSWSNQAYSPVERKKIPAMIPWSSIIKWTQKNPIRGSEMVEARPKTSKKSLYQSSMTL